jgi:hypothetical protein
MMIQKQRTILLVLLLLILTTGGGLETTAVASSHSKESKRQKSQKSYEKKEIVNTPKFSKVAVRPTSVHPGATIILEIDFIEAPDGDLNGGTAMISDSQGNIYEGIISDAKGSSGTCITSIKLSPLVKPGEIVLSIFGVDSKEHTSNTIHATLNVL